MVRRSLKDRIDKIYSRIPPPSPPLSELPVEEWVREFMEEHDPRAHRQYDEDFYKWYEGLGDNLVQALMRRIAEAWYGDDWFSVKLKLNDDEVTEIQERVEAIVPPYIDRYWREWQAEKPNRDREIIDSAKFAASMGIREDFFPNTDLPEEIRRRVDAFESTAPAREARP